MVEIKTTRTVHTENLGEEYDVIATKRSEWVNGRGKKVVQTVEEHNILESEAKEALEKLVPQEIEKIDKEIDKINKDMPDIKKEIKDVVNTREYKAFKKKLESEEYKRFFEALNREKALKQGEGRLNELYKTKDDILEWKDQMQKIVDFYNSEPAPEPKE